MRRATKRFPTLCSCRRWGVTRRPAGIHAFESQDKTRPPGVATVTRTHVRERMKSKVPAPTEMALTGAWPARSTST
jgi:hypothetical protein